MLDSTIKVDKVKGITSVYVNAESLNDICSFFSTTSWNIQPNSYILQIFLNHFTLRLESV